MTDSRGYIGTKKDAQPDSHYTVGEIDSDAAPFSPDQLGYLDDHYSGGGAATIHNYFPDGAFASDALVAVGVGQYPDGKVAYPSDGVETLAVAAITPGEGISSGNACSVHTTGSDWDEGLQLGEQSITAIPAAGLYTISFDLWSATNEWLKVQALVKDENWNAFGKRDIYGFKVNSIWQRVAVPIYAYAAGQIGCTISFDQTAYAADTTPSTTIWKIANVMFCEGSTMTFRDGDSPGWAWTGAPHASASYGPQP